MIVSIVLKILPLYYWLVVAVVVVGGGGVVFLFLDMLYVC